MDPFVEAQQVAQKCAAIAARLAELTDAEETFVQTSCALGQPCKPQLTGLIYGPRANRPTVSNLAVGQMTTALCVVTLNPANNTWVCVQPHTDIADPVAACVVLKKIVFPDHLDEGPGGPNARLYAFQVVTYLGSAANLGDVATWLPIGAVITLAGNISCSRLSLATTNILANMDIQRLRDVAQGWQPGGNAPYAREDVSVGVLKSIQLYDSRTNTIVDTVQRFVTPYAHA